MSVREETRNVGEERGICGRLRSYHAVALTRIALTPNPSPIGWARGTNRARGTRSGGLVDFVEAVGAHVGDSAERSAPPVHFQNHPALGRSGGKDKHGLRTGHVSSATGDFLALHRHCALEQFYPG